MRLKQTHLPTSSKKIKRPEKNQRNKETKEMYSLSSDSSLEEHERTERKAVKPVDDWRRDAVVLHSEPDSALLHLIEPTVL